MNPANPWIPLLAALVASAFTMTSVYLGHRFTMGRERAAKAAELGMKRRQRWEEFEEKTLLELQDKGPLLVACFRRTLGELITIADTKDLSRREAIMARCSETEDALILVFNLASRIPDDETRRAAMEFFKAAITVRDAIGQAFESCSRGVAPSALGPEVATVISLIKVANEKYIDLGIRIGGRVRDTIKAEAAKGAVESPPARWAGLVRWSRRRRSALVHRLASVGSRSAPSNSASCPPES
jgi:hypothetical protein